MMNNKRAPSLPADLLVCFPSRSHLALMPKPVSSPNRCSSDHSNKRNYHFHRRHNQPPHPHRRRQGSPVLWVKTKQSSDISEPTSPKVTCAGQIKVRQKSKNNWQSVIEEIERLHGRNRKQSRKSSFLNSSVFKKEATQFLTCLRGIRLNFRCLGSFSTSEMTSDEEEEDDEEEQQQQDYDDDDDADGYGSKAHWADRYEENKGWENSRNDPPPPNALLLMRCRSAPAKNWAEEQMGLEEKEAEDNAKKPNSLETVMRHDINFHMNSGDIVKETWLVDRSMLLNPKPKHQQLLQRSQSWKI